MCRVVEEWITGTWVGSGTSVTRVGRVGLVYSGRYSGSRRRRLWVSERSTGVVSGYDPWITVDRSV